MAKVFQTEPFNSLKNCPDPESVSAGLFSFKNSLYIYEYNSPVGASCASEKAAIDFFQFFDRLRTVELLMNSRAGIPPQFRRQISISQYAMQCCR